MNVQAHEELKARIWEIANRLRGPYRPPQYRLVMLPMVVLRRLDCVLEPTRDAVLKRRDELEAQRMPAAAMDRLLGKAADPRRKYPLYNRSPYSFARLLGDAENIAPNLVSYINGFSPTARRIFEHQFPVCQPLPHHARREADHLVGGVHRPHVVAGGELVNVPLEVLVGDPVVGAVVCPLHHRPEALDAVCAGHAVDVLAGAVVDRLMVLDRAAVGPEFVGVEGRVGVHVLADEGP